MAAFRTLTYSRNRKVTSYLAIALAILIAACTARCLRSPVPESNIATDQGRLIVRAIPAVPADAWVADLEQFKPAPLNEELPPGTYVVCFGPAEGFEAPQCDQVQVVPGETATVVGRYRPVQSHSRQTLRVDSGTSAEDAVSHGDRLGSEHVGLTVPEGDLTPSEEVETQEAGQVIEDIHVSAPGDITAAITIRHDNVTVRNVLITSPGYTTAIRVEPGLTGIIIEHTVIDGQKAEYGSTRDEGNWGNVGIKAYSAVTARRNLIYDVRQGIQLWQGAVGSTVIENHIREVWPNAPGVSTAGISYRGSDSSTGVTTISRNRVTVSGMAAISAYAESGPVQNVDIVDNLIVGTKSESGIWTGYGIRGGFVHSFRTANSSVRIEGNRFGGTFRWGTNGAVNVDQPGNTFTDNRRQGATEPEAANRDL